MPKLLIYRAVWTFIVFGTDIHENRRYVHVGRKDTEKLSKIWLEPEVEVAKAGELSIDLSENWSNKIKTDFLAALSDTVRRIDAMPEMYPVSAKNPTVRRCVVTNRIAVYYRIKRYCVEMLSIPSTRRNDTF